MVRVSSGGSGNGSRPLSLFPRAARLLPALLLLLPLVCAVVDYSGDPCSVAVYQLQRSFRPAPRLPPTVLPVLGNTQYSAESCRLSFTQHEQGWANFLSCDMLGPVKVHTCPQHCTRLLHEPHELPAAPVWGRWPYHGNSSICLSAIHAGLIADAAGGAVVLERFFPADWSNSSSQTIFPHEAWRGSLSNAVQSEPVPAAELAEPSPLSAYSWTVRSRGAVAAQRQTAPWSARSGHAHLSLFNRSALGSPHAMQHLIVGGRNASHYNVSAAQS